MYHPEKPKLFVAFKSLKGPRNPMCYSWLQEKECVAEFRVGVEEIYMYNQMSLNNLLNKAL